MNLGRKRLLVRLAIVLLVGVAGVFWSASQSSHNLTIENRSKQSVVELKLTVSGQTSTFQNIKPGGEVTAECPSGGDKLFTVEGRLADGTRVRSSGLIGEGKHFLLLPGGSLEERRKDRQ
jgi:hypothetical protein